MLPSAKTHVLHPNRLSGDQILCPEAKMRPQRPAGESAEPNRPAGDSAKPNRPAGEPPERLEEQPRDEHDESSSVSSFFTVQPVFESMG